MRGLGKRARLGDEMWEEPILAQLEGIELDDATMAAVVASLGSGPRPVALDRARIERQIRELAPVDGDPVRDRRQHATPTDAC